MYLFRKKITIFTFITLLSSAFSLQAFAACLPAELCTKVSGLADVPLGTWGGTGDLTSNYTMCVYVQNDNESNYDVTGTGTGTGSAYIVTSGTNDISVSVAFEESGAPGFIGLSETIPTVFMNPHTTDENCVGGGGNSAKIRVTVAEADMDFAISGTYTGTITLVTSPD